MTDFIQGEIDSKLKRAGLDGKGSVENNQTRRNVKNVVKLLLRKYKDYSQYIVERICCIDPFLATECIANSRLIQSPEIKECILKCSKASDGREIKSLIILYRLGETSFDVDFFDQVNLDCIKAENIFDTWRDFSLFIVWLIKNQNETSPLISELIHTVETDAQDLFQYKDECRCLMDMLLENKYYDCVAYYIESVGVENYYSITKQSYSDILCVFGYDDRAIQTNIHYCIIDSIESDYNQFDYLFDWFRNNANRVMDNGLYSFRFGVYSALIFEYIYNDSIDELENRLSGFDLGNSKKGLKNQVEYTPDWALFITDALIRATNKCIDHNRDVDFFLDLFSRINVFSYDKSLKAIDNIEKSYGLSIDADEAKEKYVEWIKNNSFDNALDIYQNTYLKCAFDFDEAIKICIENTSKEVVQKELECRLFEVKKQHYDSDKVFVRLKRLTSRKYRVFRDWVQTNIDSFYVVFQIENEYSLYVKQVSLENNQENKKTKNNYIEIIHRILSKEMSEESLEVEFEELKKQSDIPMRTVKLEFGRFLCEMKQIDKVDLFKRIMIKLSWNRANYFYRIDEGYTSYTSSDFDFFRQYKNDLITIIKRLSELKLSKKDFVDIYMNSFFKVIISPLELYNAINGFDVSLINRYSFLIERKPDGSFLLISARDFISKKIAVINDDDYYKLDSLLYRIKSVNKDSVLFELSSDDCKKMIENKYISRLERGYKKISSDRNARDHEYRAVTILSPKFYFENQSVCECIAECTIAATNIRGSYLGRLKYMIENLGECNIYGSEFYPILCSAKYLRFCGTDSNTYDHARILCHKYARNCKMLSEAFDLYLNTYVKRAISFSDYLDICKTCELMFDGFDYSSEIVVDISMDSMITPVDVSFGGIIPNKSIRIENFPSGRYYARIAVRYDLGLEIVYQSIKKIQ